VAYAPAAVRPALAALFALDERLGSVVGTTSEPQIGLIRLAWWREALERLDRAPPPAEPMLAAAAGTLVARGIGGAALAELEQGWAALLDDPLDAAGVQRFGRLRGATLFTTAARLLRAEDPRLVPAGEGWALADLAHRHSDPRVRGLARDVGRRALGSVSGGLWPVQARPLAMLVALARRDLAVDGPRHQGSPGRLLRMLALRLTGL
jgi:15-cis-phytoene synthase